MFNNILVPVDGSDSSWRALAASCPLGEKFDSTITIIHVVQPYYALPAITMAGDAPFIPLNFDELESTGHQLLAIAKTKIAGCPCQLKTRLEFGNPAEQILLVAKENNYDLIIVGRRGLSGIAEFFLGSVSTKIAQYSPVPVLIIK